MTIPAFHLRRISINAVVALVAATSLAAGVSGSSAPAFLSSCSDPFVYDPKIDEIVPARFVQGLEDAIPPVQPGERLTYHLRPWQVVC